MKLTKLSYKQPLTALAVSLALVGIVAAPAGALTLSSPTDCDDNAVLRCGALSTQSLISKYNSQAGAGAIFTHFGITKAEVEAMNTTAVAGTVTKTGNVVVNGKTVATGAVTAGRQNMPGSTKVTSGGVTFYKRPPSVSFQSASLPAYVVMENGKFSFAVIASCGNPVSAKAVEQPKPAPAAPAKPAEKPKAPAPEAPKPSAPAPQAPAPQAPVAPIEAPQELPKAGVGGMVGLLAGSLVAGTAAFQLYLRRKVSA